jgi:adenine-specific DNA-methyltransferase
VDEFRKDQENEQQEAAKKKEAPGAGNAPVDDKTRIRELEQENKDLKQQVTDLQKRVQELEAESKAAANRA